MNPHDSFDIVIVGGGVIGMACAETLSRRKLRVCIIEKGEAGRAASWAGGGLLSPLPPDQCADALRPLLEESLALYPEWRSEEHTSELQSLMRISYAVFCLKKNTQENTSHCSHT